MDVAMPSWAPYFHQFDTVVGYSDLGHIFLAGRTTGEHGVLYPFKSAAKSYGTFGDTAEFVNEVVREPGFADYVLQPDHVAAIRDLLGPLGPERFTSLSPIRSSAAARRPRPTRLAMYGCFWT